MSNLNQILLQPTDVLFFRDGRPMGGSLAGHTAAWPLPDVTNHALHAALHRAELADVHAHRRGRSGEYSTEAEHRDRKFGSLLTAGPFPVNSVGQWFLPRPKDAQVNGSVQATLQPVRSLNKDGNDDPWLPSSLPVSLEYAVANTQAPNKEGGGEPWISTKAFDAYLKGEAFTGEQRSEHFLTDDQIADREHQIGIAIDPDTQTTGQGEAAGKIYSAHYLRLREGFRLGLFAEAMDKLNGDGNSRRDLIKALLNGHPEQIVVGGQQRICSASRTAVNDTLPLPQGLSADSQFQKLPHGRFAVKWVLLTPAIWPEIPATSRDGRAMTPHPGGWLPNWIDQRSGAVLLRQRFGRVHRDYSGPKAKRVAEQESPIGARLVAAIVPKPVPVTGWALPNGSDRPEGGAKSTHLAVPAGAVYYFEADSAAQAAALAKALNWHGATGGTEIKHRRSTLLGEKGYGLGVCGTWSFFGEVLGRPMK